MSFDWTQVIFICQENVIFSLKLSSIRLEILKVYAKDFEAGKIDKCHEMSENCLNDRLYCCRCCCSRGYCCDWCCSWSKWAQFNQREKWSYNGVHTIIRKIGSRLVCDLNFLELMKVITLFVDPNRTKSLRVSALRAFTQRKFLNTDFLKIQKTWSEEITYYNTLYLWFKKKLSLESFLCPSLEVAILLRFR